MTSTILPIQGTAVVTPDVARADPAPTVVEAGVDAAMARIEALVAVAKVAGKPYVILPKDLLAGNVIARWTMGVRDDAVRSLNAALTAKAFSVQIIKPHQTRNFARGASVIEDGQVRLFWK